MIMMRLFKLTVAACHLLTVRKSLLNLLDHALEALQRLIQAFCGVFDPFSTSCSRTITSV